MLILLFSRKSGRRICFSFIVRYLISGRSTLPVKANSPLTIRKESTFVHSPFCKVCMYSIPESTPWIVPVIRYSFFFTHDPRNRPSPIRIKRTFFIMVGFCNFVTKVGIFHEYFKSGIYLDGEARNHYFYFEIEVL